MFEITILRIISVGRLMHMSFKMYIPLKALCQANAEHNNAKLFPLPVGLSSKQF